MKQKEDLGCIMKAIDSHADLAVIGVGTDYYEALKLVDAEQPDIVVIDYQFEYGGLGIIPVLKRKSPGMAVILFSPHDDRKYIQDALNQGVSAYLIQKTDVDILINVLYIVHKRGYYVVSHHFVVRLFRSLPRFRRYENFYRELRSYKTVSPRGLDFSFLNPKEMRIIGLIAQGKSTKEIGETLHLKIGTTRNYISALMRKTGIRSRLQMARYVLNSLRQSKAGKPSPMFLPPARSRGVGKFLPRLEVNRNPERECDARLK
jgi:DNA-binding NarL/FixJ family response regulator